MVEPMIFFNLCILVLGLTLPGYLLARLFRLEYAWAVAFPISALYMVETIIFFTMSGIPIRFSTMSGALLLCISCCLMISRVRTPAPRELSVCPESSILPPRLVATILIIAITVLVIVAFRTAYYPLRGLDTSFRWEGLARAMLQQQSLDFYPPISAGDYSIYLYPDGIPPLVATVYWWIYVTLGAHLPPATSISIVLQLATTMALTFLCTRHAFGTAAAWFALLAISASPLLLGGFAIGQETGFTALAVAGQLCFAWAAVRRPQRSTVVMAALFAALGALSRDYAPALALSGFVVLAWHSSTRRYLLLFTLTTLLFSAPWYLRSWFLVGNPFFSHSLPGGFNVNTIHVAIMDYYKEIFSFGQFDRARWLSLGKHLLSGGALAIGIGLPYALYRWRDSTPLLVTAMVVILLWIISVGQTAGGVIFSSRVLTPAMVALSIAVGAAFNHLYHSDLVRRDIIRSLAVSGAILLSGYSLIAMTIYPFPSPYFYSTPTSTEFNSIQQRIVDKLDASELPATGVLTDLPFVAETMLRNSRFRPVMYWSPEVTFVLDRQLAANEIQQRLATMNIRLVLVDAISPNNGFLARYDFFRERANWKTLLEIQNEAAIFYFDSP